MSIAHTASSVNAHFIKEAIIMKIMDQKEFDAQNVSASVRPTRLARSILSAIPFSTR